MSAKIYHVDAFTDKPFQGNPACVCILDSPVEEDYMQSLASEMNLSETAFITECADGFNLRWFTPVTEVDLCGHATLASAHVLWESGVLQREQSATFNTKSGVLTATTKGRLIELDFPIVRERRAEPPARLTEALGVKPQYVGKNRYDYIVEVESEDLLRGIKPDFGLLKTISARGFIVTSRSDLLQFDFVSRFFAPAAGIDEDPVTGSAHCCLGPFWKKRLGKTEFTAYQASCRGGVLSVSVRDGRVLLGGKAVTVYSGELKV